MIFLITRFVWLMHILNGAQRGLPKKNALSLQIYLEKILTVKRDENGNYSQNQNLFSTI